MKVGARTLPTNEHTANVCAYYFKKRSNKKMCLPGILTNVITGVAL